MKNKNQVQYTTEEKIEYYLKMLTKAADRLDTLYREQRMQKQMNFQNTKLAPLNYQAHKKKKGRAA